MSIKNDKQTTGQQIINMNNQISSQTSQQFGAPIQMAAPDDGPPANRDSKGKTPGPDGEKKGVPTPPKTRRIVAKFEMKFDYSY